MNRPHIICHMMMSLDGRIDCGMTVKIPGNKEYYKTLSALNAPSLLNGRVTAEMEISEKGHFTPSHPEAKAQPGFSKKRDAEGYQIILDSKGTLLWKDNTASESPLIVVVTERASQEYLTYLDGRHISWIVSGKNHVDLKNTVEILYKEFGVKRLMIGGGGTINGAFLDAGLLDEISILLSPAIDGRKGMVSVFDGIAMDREPVTLKLKDVTRYQNGALWLQYDVK